MSELLVLVAVVLPCKDKQHIKARVAIVEAACGVKAEQQLDVLGDPVDATLETERCSIIVVALLRGSPNSVFISGIP